MKGEKKKQAKQMKKDQHGVSSTHLVCLFSACICVIAKGTLAVLLVI